MQAAISPLAPQIGKNPGPPVTRDRSLLLSFSVSHCFQRKEPTPLTLPADYQIVPITRKFQMENAIRRMVKRFQTRNDNHLERAIVLFAFSPSLLRLLNK